MTALCTSAMVALLVTMLCTPVVGRVACRLGIVDRPDGHRKLHGRAVPLGGGVAVLLGATLSIAMTMFLPSLWADCLREEAWFLQALSLSAVVICSVGLVDDRYRLRGRQKLLGQLAAATILVMSGLLIRNVQVFDCTIELGVLAVPFTLFWLLGAINALNLIDGVDGLATTVGLVLSLSLASLSLLTEHWSDAVVAVALAGSLAGFLRHNYPPARIFLGDAGSMLIGLVLGTIAIRSSLKGPATIALAAPTAVWAIPIFDVSMAILRRKLTGRSLYTPDRAHLHHCLQNRGLSQQKTVAWIAVLCAGTAVGALASVYRRNELLALASVAIAIGTLVVMRVFGHAECRLLFLHLANLMRSLMPSGRRSQTDSRQVCARLQGNGKWDRLWHSLIVYAHRFQLNSVQLNVNLPAIHEEYHARWQRNGQTRADSVWETTIPLTACGLTVGSLQMAGAPRPGAVSDWMAELMLGLKPIEADLTVLLQDGTQDSLMYRFDQAGSARHAQHFGTTPRVSTELVPQSRVA